MKKIRNNKGMTLVEIIIVFMVTSILLIVIGGMVLNSIGFFQRETVNDNNKYITDTIASLVREKVLYATDVKVTKTKQGKGWEWFSIDDEGHILLNDGVLYKDDFYNSHKLEVSARIYQSNRMDIVFRLMEDGEQVYKTTSTINLVNVDGAKIQSGDEVSNTGLGTEMVEVTELTGYRIYFKLSVRDIIDGKDPVDPNPPEPEKPILKPNDEGTVANESVYCMDEAVTKPGEKGNNKGEYIQAVAYKIGDFVKFEGVYYRAMADIRANATLPSTNTNWKKIYSDWDLYSKYSQGDIVRYMNRYYQAMFEKEIPAGTTPDNSLYWSTGYADVASLVDATNIAPSYLLCSCYPTVGDEIYDKKSINDKGEYSSGSTYNLDDFVYIKNKDGSVTWYRSMANNHKNPPNKNGYTGWKVIDRFWNGENSYEVKDIIVHPRTPLKDQKYYQAQQEVRGNGQKLEPGKETGAVENRIWIELPLDKKMCDIKPTETGQ